MSLYKFFQLDLQKKCWKPLSPLFNRYISDCRNLYYAPSTPASLWEAFQQKHCILTLTFLQTYSNPRQFCHPQHLQDSGKWCGGVTWQPPSPIRGDRRLLGSLQRSLTIPLPFGNLGTNCCHTKTVNNQEQTEFTFPMFQFLLVAISDSDHSKVVVHLKHECAALTLYPPPFLPPTLQRKAPNDQLVHWLQVAFLPTACETENVRNLYY